MEPIYLSITSLIMVLYEAVVGSNKFKRITKSIFWVVAILLATGIIILIHAGKM
jgi:hypothetical protein